ncbi:MAG: 3-phosphoshikimate 1-carboxyvinyltransferase, partial [Pseudomonadota bacterium]
MERITIEPSGALQGTLRVPGDKSISHRALMLSALAPEHTEIYGLLMGEDVLATRAAMIALGAGISEPEDGYCVVDGVGLYGLLAPLEHLDMGNSGTAMRLLAGILAGQRFEATLFGDESLTRRPMRRVIDPLTAMGASITGDDGRPPLVVRPAGDGLRGINYTPPVASAQVKSCVVLAGLYAKGTTRVTETLPTRDHTERMLAAFGAPLEVDGETVIVRGGGQIHTPGRIDVPGDISSAAFWLVAASVIPGSDLRLEGVGMNPRRTGILGLLERMGGAITITNEREVCGEPVADLRVRHARLRGIDIGAADVPAAIDEFPVLFVAAALAEGTTVLSGAEELRAKESDRIAVMAKGLAAMGANLEERPDGIRIEGGSLRQAAVDAAEDHRCAMALLIAGAAAAGAEVHDTENIRTSYPDFLAHAKAVGLRP